MIDVEGLLKAPPGWVDTPEQAAIRACLIAALVGHDPPGTVQIATELIAAMRDHFLSGTAQIRRQAAREAREGGMKAAELAAASNQTVATVMRLLTESRAGD